jgi:hypothetical protein
MWRSTLAFMLVASGVLRAADNRTSKISVSSNLVQIAMQAQDGDGRFVTNLLAEQLLLEDHGKVRSIDYFSLEEGPISLRVLLDASGSMDRYLGPALAALETLVLSAHPDDEITIDGFREQTWTLGNGMSALLSARSLRANGGTGLRDAIDCELRELRRKNSYPVLLIVTDGTDTASRLTWKELRAHVAESSVAIYAALVGFEERENHRSRWELRDLVIAAGGRSFDVRRPRSLAAELERLEIRQRYILSFQADPKARPGRRNVHVRLKPSLGRRLRLSWRREYSIPSPTKLVP